MIQFQNINKSFRNQKILNNINLNIKKGELAVLIGPSGCGKTTTLKMINRLIRPTSGHIFINGEDVEKKDIIKLRRKIGYVIQQTGLFPHMTVKENIELIPRLEKVNKQKIIEKTYELMHMIDLNPEEFLYRFPTQLSGGQMQRIGVARAFAYDPDIILMDEPFSALDPVSRNQLQQELVELQDKMKKTIVFVTHDMDEAVKIADKICIMNKGEIVQCDTPEDILKNPVNEFVSNFVGKNRIWTVPDLIKAKDIMNENPITANANDTLKACIDKMRVNKVDSIFIVDENNRLEGLITIRTLQNVKSSNVLAKDVMNKSLFTVYENYSILNLLQLVNDNDLSAIPIVDRQRRLKGLITPSTLVSSLSEQYLDNDEAGDKNELS
ncbi:MAG: ABC transporter ATP-binding protein [Sebaldella sp.]|nr:ABC transporter ATP-binding protein [Sebaldella sp.]